MSTPCRLGSVSFSQAFLFEGQLIYLVEVCRSFSLLVYHSLGLHPYDWTDRVRRAWRGILLSF